MEYSQSDEFIEVLLYALNNLICSREALKQELLKASYVRFLHKYVKGKDTCTIKMLRLVTWGFTLIADAELDLTEIGCIVEVLSSVIQIKDEITLGDSLITLENLAFNNNVSNE